MMVERIVHYDGINRTPALALALRGQLEMLERGLCDPVLNIYWDQQAIVAFGPGGAPIGVLTWQHTKAFKQFDIAIGYVLPDYRAHHIYRRLWRALVAKAAELGVEVIRSSTHVDNLEMQAAAGAQGRKFQGMVLGYQVPETPPDGACSWQAWEDADQ